MMKKVLDIAANNYFAVENEAWKQIQRDCSCDNPGKDLQCIDCPCYLKVRKEVFSKLHAENFRECPPPLFFKENEDAYKSLSDIADNPNLKTEALRIYEETKDISHTSKALNIEEDIVLIWVKLAEENQAFYSNDFRKLCVETLQKHSRDKSSPNLYIHLWAKIIGVSNGTLQSWVKNILTGKKSKSNKEYIKQLILKRWGEYNLEPQQKLKVIAKELGVQVDSLKPYIYALNIKLNDYIDEETIAKCIELYQKYSKSISGRTSIYQIISDEIGISYSSAYRFVQKSKALKSQIENRQM